jgi:hypothetical protein
LIWDAGQIMEDLIPISRREGGVFVGDAGCWMSDSKDLFPPIKGGLRGVLD